MPKAALLALAGFLFVEIVLLGLGGPWQQLNNVLDRWHHLEFGITASRVELRAADSATLPEVFVIGSSRANAGFVPETVSYDEWPAAAMHRIAYGGLKVYELRSVAEELARSSPMLVVLAISEIDLWGPLQVVPHSGFSSLPAVLDLYRSLGLSRAWGERKKLLRLTLESLSRSYRYRVVLQRALVDPLRRFEFDQRYPRRRGGSLRWNLMAGEPQRPLPDVERERLIEEARTTLPAELSARQINVGFNQLREITHGPHGEIHKELVRRSIEALLAVGTQVVIAEPPVHPIASEIYDASLRREFLDFVATLQADLGVGFLPIEASGPYLASDFHDLTHLGFLTGAGKFTRGIMREIDGYLAHEPARP